MANRFYVDDYRQLTVKEQTKLRKKFVCAECGEWVTFFLANDGRVYLACHRHKINKHEGVSREFTPPSEQNTIGRREQMSGDNVKTDQALIARGIPLTGLITSEQATTILTTVWKGAPDLEVYKAAMLCQDYGLHPLMGHVFLICFNEGKPNESWVTVLGIKATRLIMSRQGTFSYIDDTPRIMSDEEQIKIFGFVDAANIVAITKLRTRDGLEASGYGKYPKKGGYLMGEDKGNSRENMAFIRSERNCFGRIYPDANLPKVEVVDEQYMETPSGKVDKATGELIPEPEEEAVEAEFTEVPEPEPEPGDEVIPEPEEEQPPPEPALDESPPTKEDLAELTKWREKAGADMAALGQMIANELKWKVPKTLSGLKKWQVIELIDIYKKAVGG